MASDVMARSWPLRLWSLHAGFWAGERVIESEREQARLGVGVYAALDVMSRTWSLRPWSLHADSCAGERVIESEREPGRLETGV